MGRRAPRPLALALDRALEQAEPQTPLAAAQRVWPAAVGEAIARQALPVAERGGVLTISCTSATWTAELDLMQAELLMRLEERLGEGSVRGLRFVTGAP